MMLYWTQLWMSNKPIYNVILDTVYGWIINQYIMLYWTQSMDE